MNVILCDDPPQIQSFPHGVDLLNEDVVDNIIALLNDKPQNVVV